MARTKKHAAYDADRIMKELMVAVVEAYEENGELKLTAKEFEISELKVRKLLITADAYHNDLSEMVNCLYKEGHSVKEIQMLTGLGRSSVNGYLPYTKAVYKAEELSLNAEKIGMFRRRQQAVRALAENPCEDRLWNVVIAFQKYPFHTASGLPFVYELKKERSGRYNKELIVSRCRDSKTIVWSSVLMAYEKAVDLIGEVVERPKGLGDIRGVSYIYPLFYRFGIIEIPDIVANKMEPKRPLSRKN